MKNIALGLVLIGLITACGSDSDSGSIYVTDLSDLADTKGKPQLDEVTVVNGQSLLLNTQANGSVEDAETQSVMFTPLQSQLVLLILESNAEDLDLIVRGDGEFYSSTSADSYEVIVLEVNAESTYTVDVESFYGSGDYTLTLVEANRSSLNLTQGEFFVVSRDVGTDVCDDEEYSFDNDSYYIINPYQGYIESPGSDRIQLDYIGNNRFSFTNSYSDEEYTSNSEGVLTIDPATGSVSGYSNGTSTDRYNGIVTECVDEITMSGRIVL